MGPTRHGTIGVHFFLPTASFVKYENLWMHKTYRAIMGRLVANHKNEYTDLGVLHSIRSLLTHSEHKTLLDQLENLEIGKHEASIVRNPSLPYRTPSEGPAS